MHMGDKQRMVIHSGGVDSKGSERIDLAMSIHRMAHCQAMRKYSGQCFNPV